MQIPSRTKEPQWKLVKKNLYHPRCFKNLAADVASALGLQFRHGVYKVVPCSLLVSFHLSDFGPSWSAGSMGWRRERSLCLGEKKRLQTVKELCEASSPYVSTPLHVKFASWPCATGKAPGNSSAAPSPSRNIKPSWFNADSQSASISFKTAGPPKSSMLCRVPFIGVWLKLGRFSANNFSPPNLEVISANAGPTNFDY